MPATVEASTGHESDGSTVREGCRPFSLTEAKGDAETQVVRWGLWAVCLGSRPSDWLDTVLGYLPSMVHQPDEVKGEGERTEFIKMMMPETEQTIIESSE